MTEPQMPQDATPRNKAELRQLSPVQLLAAQMVAVGASDETIANTYGLNRSTVYRWRIYSPLFQAEVNRHREVLNAKIGDKLRESVFGAVDTISQLMAKSDDDAIKLKAASMLLGLVPLTIQSGPTDPREIVRDIAVRRAMDSSSASTMRVHEMEGTKPIKGHIRDVIFELEMTANETTGDPKSDDLSATATTNPHAPPA